MPVVGIEVSTRCKSCGTVVAVNAVAPAVACSSCERPMPVDATRWMLLLEEPLRRGPGLLLHTELTAPFTTEDGTFHRVYRREDPACRGCGAALTRDDDSVRAVYKIAPDGSSGVRWLVSRQHGGALGPEEKMAVGHEGTIWMLGDGGAARRFGPDGRVQLITNASRENDRQAIEDDDD